MRKISVVKITIYKFYCAISFDMLANPYIFYLEKAIFYWV